MSQGTALRSAEERCVAEMAQQMTERARGLYRWVRQQERTLEDMEAEVRPLLQELGAEVVGRLCQAQAPAYPVDTVTCHCGQQALYQRQRTAQVKTLLGSIPVARPYYLCATCHHGHAPLDRV